MPFERPTLQEITDRITKGIESRLFGKTALLRRAVLRILARTFAGAIHTCYGYLLAIVKQLFVYTATGIWLDRHGLMWGVTRKAGSFATSGGATFSGTVGVLVPKDTRIQDERGVEYGTTIDHVFVTGFALIPIQAVEPGEDGNIDVDPAPFILQMVSPISGVSNDVYLYSSVTGGVDQETDEEYRKRILQKIQKPPMGGNAEDYVTWATDVNGVDQAWSYPLAYGPGTVAVVITATGNNPVASGVLIGDVAAYINDRKPIGATVYVQTVEDSFGAQGTAQLNYTIGLKPNTSDFQDAIKENLRDLFYPMKPGTTILISQIRGAISASGVQDYEIMSFSVDSIGKPIDDYSLPGFTYPELNTINFYAKA